MKEVYLKKQVLIEAETVTIWSLYLDVKEKRLVSMNEWLQRLEQKTKWQKKNGQKAVSYIRSFFSGNNILTPFYCVNINVLKDHLIDSLDESNSNTIDTNIKIVYRDMLDTIDELKRNGTQSILLDGQNRLNQAIVPFFDGVMLSNDYGKPFVLCVDGEDITFNNFKFTELDEDIKECFRSQPVIICRGVAGDIDAYVKSIIDMNDGVSWSPLEAAIIQPTALNYQINKDIFRTPQINALFGNDELSGNVFGMTSNHAIEKKGDARYIAELTHMINSNCLSGIGNEESVCRMLLDSDTDSVKSYKKVREYLIFISNVTDCLLNTDVPESSKPFDKDSLRGLIIMLDIMRNKNNLGHLDSLLSIKSLEDIQKPKTIIEDFIRWHNKMNDSVANPVDFKDRKPLPGTYAFNVKGASADNIRTRVKFITDYINNNCQSWVELGFFKADAIDYRLNKTALLEKSGYKDAYKKSNNDINIRTKVSIDHVISKKGSRNGSDDISNLLVTNPVSNSIKSNSY
jgi:hypothetical protein